MASRQELLRLIHGDREHQIQFLQSLVQTRSPNPPGDTRAAIAVVNKFLWDLGIESDSVEPLDNAPNLLSRFYGGEESASVTGKRLVLNGHIDHFPVHDASQWERDPYSGALSDNGSLLHGCGSVDMKAGTAASILAYTYLHRFRHHFDSNTRCVLAVVSDEETGGKYGTRYLLDDPELNERWGGDVVLNAEPSGMGSIRFGEKGTLRMTFSVRTQGGHGAYLHRDEGAIRVACRLIDQGLLPLEDLRGEGMDPKLKAYLERPEVRKVTDEIMGDGAADAVLKPTVNIGTIRGGAKVNMIPDECVFEVDIRLPIGLEHKTVLARLDKMMEKFPRASYEVQQAASNPYNVCEHDHEMVRLIAKNAKEVTKERGDESKQPIAIAGLGATDCKHYRYRHIPAYAYGASPETMAEKDERVSVQEFLDLVKIHTLAAWDYLGGPA